MNIDLITKLAKLANNNPNENEANSAARRVCKLLEEGKFDFGRLLNTRPPYPPIRKEQTASVQQRGPQRYGDWDDYEFIKDIYNEFSKSGGFDPTHSTPPKAEKKYLTCMTCGKMEVTEFVGPPQMYKCYKCIFEEVQGAKK